MTGFAVTGPRARASLDHATSGGPEAKKAGISTAGKWTSFFAGTLLLASLGACSWGDPDTVYPESDNRRATGNSYESSYEKYGSVFGEGGANVLGDDSGNGASGSGIDVNSYLWRASLDTISFMPLASADPFGGVIITDWYSPPETQSERFKVNVYIFGRELRADGVRAAVFRQNQQLDGSWTDAEVDQQTVTDLENAILARARQLRIASLQ